MIKTVCLDTNVLIRFFRNDHPLLSSQAKEIISQAEKGKNKLYIDEIVVAETVWAMSTVYEESKQAITTALAQLIQQKWVKNPRKKLILNSLTRFSRTNISYIDCWIYELAKAKAMKLETFDKDLQKLT